jgi:hypothetical protein
MRSASLVLAVLAMIAQSDVAKPSTVAGTWETATGDSIDGIFLKASNGGFKDWRTAVEVRVFHRRAGHEQWGWYVTGRSDGGATFDGQRLQIAKVGLDLSFNTDRWGGTWTIDGVNRNVTLGRPHAASGAIQHPLCGEWEGDARMGTSGSIDVAQSVDGVVTAWMHRDFGSSMPVRYGEPLRVAPSDRPSFVLQLESAGGSEYRYVGMLSPDKPQLNGVWRAGDDDPERHTLSAPRIFRRTRGCS